MSFCGSPLNLSTTTRDNNNKVMLSKLPEHKSQNFQAGCKVWSVTSSPSDNVNVLKRVAVTEMHPSDSWTEVPAASTSDEIRSSFSAATVNSSPLTDRSFGHFQLSQVKHRGPKHPVPDEMKDERYFKRRHRNNEAAKRSRLARKERQETELHRIALMEFENAALRTQMLTLRAEYETLAQIILLRRRDLVGAAFMGREERNLSGDDSSQEEVKH